MLLRNVIIMIILLLTMIIAFPIVIMLIGATQHAKGMIMDTWLDDLKKKNPALAADYAVTGNQSREGLKNMVKALSLFPALNTTEDNKRLAAAKRILKAINPKK